MTGMILGLLGFVIVVAIIVFLPQSRRCPQCKKRFTLHFDRHTAQGEVYKCSSCDNFTY